jgi:transposase
MMQALVGGERDPQVLAQLALRSLRAKIPELQEAFTGGLSDHHAFVLAQMLRHVDAKNGILRMSLAARSSPTHRLLRA